MSLLVHHAHAMPFGATLLPAGGVRFRLWAPSADCIDLTLRCADGTCTQQMRRDGEGWHEWVDPDAGPGTRYGFVTPDGVAVPDPASRRNPDGVHGASEVVDPHAYAWQHGDWAGRAWHEAVVYELHVGTFTPAGTYLGAIERLHDLVALGITAVELMPLATFPGAHGWGYDGVLPFAPQPSYGTPDELKQLVDTAHGLGLMVLLDVVYNHFGPEGNYLPGYVPEFFNPAHQTPWGAAINVDGAHSRSVRDFFIHNALYWVEEFRFDGLRLDAVHAIRDDSAEHLCEEIGTALRALAAASQPPRHLHLVLENDANSAILLERDERFAPIAADAQWNDDLHHAAHVLASGEVDGYYADYADAPLERLGRAFAEGFVYQGEPSAVRDGDPRGEPSAHLPSVAFVPFLQNHDQIGNRAFGERLAVLAARTDAGPQRLEALQAALLLSPQIPMLFMGEEFAASAPFLYFCDFGPELAEAVSTGRREEFKRFAIFKDEAARARIPDPNDARSFASCRLDWHERERGDHAATLKLVSELLAVRHARLVPRLAHATLGGSYSVDGECLQVAWVLGEGSVWHLALNLGAAAVDLPMDGELVFALRADGASLGARGVRVSVQSTRRDAAAAEVAAEAIAEAADDARTYPPVTQAVAPPASSTDAEPA